MLSFRGMDAHYFVFNGGKLAQVAGQFTKKHHISCALEIKTSPSGGILSLKMAILNAPPLY